ncbi:L,D-transpeptidase family protein [Ancylobacter sp. TS-1]|nr:L,D-transpeptidase family protein [Ancylobacter sp. TS-1]
MQPAAVQAATTPASASPSPSDATPATAIATPIATPAMPAAAPAIPVATPAAAVATPAANAPVASVTPAATAPEPVAPRIVVAQINLSKQRMEVIVDGQPRYSWPVSTARKGYRTPTGSYGVQRMHRRYYSRKYDNAPMPYSIFFNGGYAIHGTTDIRRLGRPASHGCVRLHPNNAAALFALVKEYGSANTRIIVTR